MVAHEEGGTVKCDIVANMVQGGINTTHRVKHMCRTHNVEVTFGEWVCAVGKIEQAAEEALKKIANACKTGFVYEPQKQYEVHYFSRVVKQYTTCPPQDLDNALGTAKDLMEMGYESVSISPAGTKIIRFEKN